jgi:uncharacterized membrane protein YkgB
MHINPKKFARLALLVIYVWFGALKLFNLSPANPLVGSLLERTLPFISFSTFIILLGIFEVLLGILFIIPNPKVTRVAKWLFWLHMVATTLPLVAVPAMAWQSFLVPTLEGQYIIKNLALMAIVLNL